MTASNDEVRKPPGGRNLNGVVNKVPYLMPARRGEGTNEASHVSGMTKSLSKTRRGLAHFAEPLGIAPFSWVRGAKCACPLLWDGFWISSHDEVRMAKRQPNLRRTA